VSVGALNNKFALVELARGEHLQTVIDLFSTESGIAVAVLEPLDQIYYYLNRLLVRVLMLLFYIFSFLILYFFFFFCLFSLGRILEYFYIFLLLLWLSHCESMLEV
jgi:ABC-type proline/glycine betaine transport system permease subunit